MKTDDNMAADIMSAAPPKQEGKTIQNQAVRAFAVSLQGASHIARGNIPCQDYSDICWLEAPQILIAAIADGLGSCILSHWGAYYAVTAAIASLEENISKEANGKKYELNDIEKIKEFLLEAFEAAQDTVEQKADEAQQAVSSFQSTLTIAVYDGVHVYCCHCGDDGVVIQEQSGVVKMITRRLKGEEASSVYPLQSRPDRWQITGSKNPAAGFVMATDGILDYFALGFTDYYGVNYNQGIYYPFMKSAIYGLSDMNHENAAEETLAYYKELLNSGDFRRQVTDDLTLVSVISPKLLLASTIPRFNADIWKTVYEEHRKVVKALLAGKKPDPIDDNPVKIPDILDDVKDIKEIEEIVIKKPDVKDPDDKRGGELWNTICQILHNNGKLALIAALAAVILISFAAGFAAGRSTAPGKNSAELTVSAENTEIDSDAVVEDTEIDPDVPAENTASVSDAIR